MVHVLFRHVRVRPRHFDVKPASDRIMFELGDFRSDNSFEAVEYGARAQSFNGTRPLGPVSKTDGIVVPICVPEP